MLFYKKGSSDFRINAGDQVLVIELGDDFVKYFKVIKPKGDFLKILDNSIPLPKNSNEKSTESKAMQQHR